MKREKKGSSRFSDAENVRSVVDLVDMARMFTESGSLPMSEEEAVQRYSVLAKVSLPGARRVYRVRSLIRMPSVCAFIQDNKVCRVLQDREFAKGNLSIATGGGVMSVDFIETFLPSEDRDGSVGALRAISHQYLPPAREEIVLIAFKLTTVLATICGWLTDNLLGDILEAKKALERVTSVDWSEARKMFQGDISFSVGNMVEGWHIVMEVMKICTQEL